MEKLGINLSASLESVRIDKDEQEAADNEEFYETIEAPKFVDFTFPDHYRPDDRYWFCSRVGCDRKHEEELDSERIYKDFVLRAMAARSPNVKLHKALNSDCSSKAVKCPLSVPAKSSKSRLSKLAVISSISLKKDEKKERAKPLSKVCPPTTPKMKGKEVAAKYLTTPRNKKISSDGNGFQSVQNAAKPTNLVVPKARVVAKALTFPSPKKAFNLKSSVELRMTKLCQKMKKLEVTSQRKPAIPLQSSARLKSSNKSSGKSITRPAKQDVEGKKNKGKSTKQTGCANETEGEKVCVISKGQSSEGKSNGSPDSELTDMTVDVKGIAQENSEKVVSEYVDSHVEGSESEEIHNDDKENANTGFDENRSFSNKNNNSGREILGIRKVTEAVGKNLKGQATTNGAPGLKLMKLKTTNPKPFKLRTDERGILREANLERRNHATDPQKEAALVSTTPQKGIVGSRPIKKEAKAKAPIGHSKQELEHTTTFESSKEKSSSARVLQPHKNFSVTSEIMTPNKLILHQRKQDCNVRRFIKFQPVHLVHCQGEGRLSLSPKSLTFISPECQRAASGRPHRPFAIVLAVPEEAKYTFFFLINYLLASIDNRVQLKVAHFAHSFRFFEESVVSHVCLFIMPLGNDLSSSDYQSVVSDVCF